MNPEPIMATFNFALDISHPLFSILLTETNIFSRQFRRLWNRFDASQQENIAHNSEQQDYGCGYKSGGEGVRSRDDVAGNDGRRDGRDLAAEIHRAGKGAYAFPWRNQRGNGPGRGGGRSQSSQGKADPDQRGPGAVSTGRAKDRQTEGHSRYHEIGRAH